VGHLSSHVHVKGHILHIYGITVTSVMYVAHLVMK